MTTGCNVVSTSGIAAERSDSASTLELGKYNHPRETDVIGVYK